MTKQFTWEKFSCILHEAHAETSVAADYGQMRRTRIAQDGLSTESNSGGHCRTRLRRHFSSTVLGGWHSRARSSTKGVVVSECADNATFDSHLTIALAAIAAPALVQVIVSVTKGGQGIFGPR